jgi:hypothetical protein
MTLISHNKSYQITKLHKNLKLINFSAIPLASERLRTPVTLVSQMSSDISSSAP